MPAPPNRRPDTAAHFAQLLASRIPDAVAKSLSPGEYNDRLVEAVRLSAQAADPALSADLRKAAKIRAQAVLCAQPRDVTTRQHRELIAKAATAPPAQAAAIRRKAEELIEELHPMAPRRGTVAKAKKAPGPDVTPVYNEHGQLIGIVDTDKITPLGGGRKPADPQQAAAAAPAGAPAAGQPVAKSATCVTVWDQHGRAYMTRRTAIRKTASPRPLEDGEDPLAPLDPAAQARNRGPVRAGGTTGLGKPRAGAPATSLPGEVPDRIVVKAAGWRDVHNRAGKLVGVIKAADVITPAPEAERRARADTTSYCNVFDAQGRRFGFAYRPNVLPVRRGRR
jgi:hypothetical protein